MGARESDLLMLHADDFDEQNHSMQSYIASHSIISSQILT